MTSPARTPCRNHAHYITISPIGQIQSVVPVAGQAEVFAGGAAGIGREALRGANGASRMLTWTPPGRELQAHREPRGTLLARAAERMLTDRAGSCIIAEPLTGCG